MKKLIALFCALPCLALAQSIEYSTWYRGTNPVMLCSYWWDNFPNRVGDDGLNLITAVPTGYWNSLSVAKRTAIRDKLAALLAGNIQLSRANLATARDQLAAASINAELVLPGETPTVGAKFYFVVCGRGYDPYSVVTNLGLSKVSQ